MKAMSMFSVDDHISISDIILRNRQFCCHLDLPNKSAALSITEGSSHMSRPFTRKAALVLAALVSCWVVSGCSSAPETDAERQARWTAGNLNSWETEHGIGPITEDMELAAVDPAKAVSGRDIFIKKCATCHYLDMKKTGPPLRDVTKRRSSEYVLNQILNPEQMGKFHPDGRKLVAQYAQYMTIQGITRENATDLLEFLRSEMDKPAVPADQQPGFGTPPPPPGN
jgi:cytochrome c2